MSPFDHFDGSGFGSLVNSGFDSFNLGPGLTIGDRILVVVGTEYTWGSRLISGFVPPDRNMILGANDANRLAVFYGEEWLSTIQTDIFESPETPEFDFAPHTRYTGQLSDYSMIIWSTPRGRPSFWNELASWPGLLVVIAPPAWQNAPFDPVAPNLISLLPSYSAGTKDILRNFGFNGSVAWAEDSRLIDNDDNPLGWGLGPHFRFCLLDSTLPIVQGPSPLQIGIDPFPDIHENSYAVQIQRSQSVLGGNAVARTLAHPLPYETPSVLVGFPTVSSFESTTGGVSLLVFGSYYGPLQLNNNSRHLVANALHHLLAK